MIVILVTYQCHTAPDYDWKSYYLKTTDSISSNVTTTNQLVNNTTTNLTLTTMTTSELTNPTNHTTSIPQIGDTCSNPLSTSNAISKSGGYLFHWEYLDKDIIQHHDKSCDSELGGDQVIIYTALSNSTLSLSATWNSGFSKGYLSLEVLEDDCETGKVLYCSSSPEIRTISTNISLTLGKVYYIWIGEGYAGKGFPNCDLYFKEDLADK